MAGFRLGAVLAAALVAASVATGVVFAAQFIAPVRPAPAAAAVVKPTAPTAAAVATQLAGATNARSTELGGGKIAHVSCLHGSPRSYACSYVRTSPSKTSSCAVAILLWTPERYSTFTVQTAGQVALAPGECGPVTKVLHVLGTSG